MKPKHFNFDWVDGTNNRKVFSWIKIPFLANEFFLINFAIKLIENFEIPSCRVQKQFFTASSKWPDAIKCFLVKPRAKFFDLLIKTSNHAVIDLSSSFPLKPDSRHKFYGIKQSVLHVVNASSGRAEKKKIPFEFRNLVDDARSENRAWKEN